MSNEDKTLDDLQRERYSGEAQRLREEVARLQKIVDLGREPLPSQTCAQSMTYRQWLIGMAMQGLIAQYNADGAEVVAKYAVENADQIIFKLDNEELVKDL